MSDPIVAVYGAVMVLIYLAAQLPLALAAGLWARRFRPANRFEYLTVTGTLWLLLMIALPGICGLVGVMTPSVLFLAALLTGAVAVVSEHQQPPMALPPLKLSAPEQLLLASSLALIAYQWRMFGMIPVIGSDALLYHLFYPAVWLTSGTLERIVQPGLVTASYPCYGELIYAWNMAPLLNDFFAKNFQFFGLLLAIPAVVAAGIAVRLRRVAAIAAATVMVFTAVVFRSAAVPNTDLMVGAALLIAVTLLATAARRNNPMLFLLAGAGFGVAAGTKFLGFMLAPGALLLMGGAILLWLPRCRKIFWWSVLAFAVVGSPCYIANWIVYGNPVFPVRIGIGKFELFSAGMTLPAETIGWRTAWSFFVNGDQNGVAFWSAVILLGCLAATVAAPFFLRSRQQRCARRALWCLGAGVTILLLLQLAIFPRDAQSRQIIPLAMLLAAGSAGFFTLLARRRHGEWLVAAVALILAWANSFDQFDYRLHSIGVAGFAAVFWLLFRLADRRIAGRVACGAVTLLLILYVGWTFGGANGCASELRSRFISVQDETARRQIAIETGGAGAAIAYFGSFFYLYLGDSYENQVLSIPISRSGKPELNAYQDMVEMRTPCEYPEFLRRLRAANVRYLVTEPRIFDVPNREQELNWALEHPEDFIPKIVEPGFGFFELKPEPLP